MCVCVFVHACMCVADRNVHVLASSCHAWLLYSSQLYQEGSSRECVEDFVSIIIMQVLRSFSC